MKFPLRHPHFFNVQKFMMPNKGIKTRKVGGIEKIANILLKMNNGFSKILAKGMHLIEFENCNFFSNSEGGTPLRSFWEGTPPQTPLFKFSKIYKSSDKGIKTIKVRGSSDMIMYPIVYLKRFFSVKFCQKVCTNRANWVSKMQFF